MGLCQGGIAAGTLLGLVEIEEEDDTRDGPAPSNFDDVSFAVDGLLLSGKHLKASFLGG
jgi:hypothetical protein